MSSHHAENLFQPVSDVYGMLRDEHHRAVFPRSDCVDNLTSLKATDAKVIAEVDLPHGGIPGLEPARIGTDSSGRDYPCRYIISSPNADWLPDIGKYHPTVRMNQDTRFGYHDFSLWPQIYFVETRHLAFARRRPEDSELATHPFSILWHDLTHVNFDYEPGTIFTDLGRVSSNLQDEVFDFRGKLTARIKALLLQPPPGFRDAEKAALVAAEEGMRLTSVCLRTAAQSYLMTRATFTLFQRHALEGLACVEMLTVWAQKPPPDGDEVPLDCVDPTVVGAVTASVQVAVDLAMRGVPIWLVRPPHLVSAKTIRILGKEHPEVLRNRASTIPIDQMKAYYTGPPTYNKNRVCLSLHLGHLHLGGRGEVYREIIYVAVPSGSSGLSESSVVDASSSHPFVPYKVGPSDAELTGIAYTVNVEKFKSLEVHFCPPVMPNWKQALHCMPRDPKLIEKHDDARLCRGYALIDPWLIARNDRIGERNLVVWLFLRSAWISQVTTLWAAGQPFPSSQDWRSFATSVARRMGFDWTEDQPLSSTSSGAHRPVQKKKSGKRLTGSRAVQQSTESIEASLVKAFPLNLPSSITKQDLYWRGNIVLNASDYDMRPLPIPDTVRAEILWDLLEQNFRIELLATDRCIIPRAHISLLEAQARDEFVLQVFPSGSPVNTNMSEESLGARRITFRAEYLNQFRRVIQTWGDIGKPLMQDKFRNISKSSTKAVVDELEDAAFKIYCTTFFRYFGRAPTVPHICPSMES